VTGINPHSKLKRLCYFKRNWICKNHDSEYTVLNMKFMEVIVYIYIEVICCCLLILLSSSDFILNLYRRSCSLQTSWSIILDLKLGFYLLCMDLMTGINPPSILNLLYHFNRNYICENHDTKFIFLNLKVNMKYIGVFLHLQRSYWLVGIAPKF
jgi:hypothetical protein